MDNKKHPMSFYSAQSGLLLRFGTFNEFCFQCTSCYTCIQTVFLIDFML